MVDSGIHYYSWFIFLLGEEFLLFVENLDVKGLRIRNRIFKDNYLRRKIDVFEKRIVGFFEV